MLRVREGHFLYTVYHAVGLQRYIILRGRRPKKDYISLRYGSGKDIGQCIEKDVYEDCNLLRVWSVIQCKRPNGNIYDPPVNLINLVYIGRE